MQVTVQTQKQKEPMGDLFGIFFEDINYAADGGLYGELVQNRAFEYSSLDNPEFRPLYAWEKLEDGGKMDWLIERKNPVSKKNPHYLVLNVREEGTRMGVRNIGYNEGIYVEAGKKYRFSCYVGCSGKNIKGVQVSITDANGNELCSKEFAIEDTIKHFETGTIADKNPVRMDEKERSKKFTWKKYELVLEPSRTEYCGRLQLTVKGTGKIAFDFVSLFPEDTFKQRKNGLRKDIAQMLEELHPKFMRFPGGCLTHDGSLEMEERDSQYFWKNTLGPITDRGARRNNWNYHQTLGLGYFEYFQFCEDIGAKPLPVLPAGYNPHSGQAVPMDEMQPWIDDALDLIEFANGDCQTKWGKIRCELGHEKPFGLEYLAIGNEEDREAFFERYNLFHQAIRKKYPNIQIINSAGPFASGEIYERGWKSAIEQGSDLIDEHYYQSPEWFLANSRRYDNYDSKTKVFLGEYACQGNKWYNALAEAAFMTGLERNVKSVGLACYAPLLCNVDYVRWTPDLIWFNNHQVYGTPSYYVQKLFMKHQGSYRLECKDSDRKEQIYLEEKSDSFVGKYGLEAYRSKLVFSDICYVDSDTNEETNLDDILLEEKEKIWLGEQAAKNFTIKFKVCQKGPGQGFAILFGGKDEKNQYRVSFGGWGNADIFITNRINGSNANLTQKCFQLLSDREYQIELRVNGRHMQIFVDGKMEIEADCEPFAAEPLYYSASVDDNGDVILKLVNVSRQLQEVMIFLDGMKQADGVLYAMEGFAREDSNSFEEPKKIIPKESKVQVKDGRLEICMPEDSVRVYRFKHKI